MNESTPGLHSKLWLQSSSDWRCRFVVGPVRAIFPQRGNEKKRGKVIKHDLVERPQSY
jgi:hypothetical protein